MKKIILSFGIVAASFIGVQAQVGTTPTATIENASGADIKFETEVIDYGTIEQGADGVREFKFTNTGKAPLIISNAQGSCGCTVPTWPKEPIKPGESSVIKVKYDTKRVGPINKSVTITSNASEASKVLRIKGTIVAPQTSPVKEQSGAPVNN